MAAKKKTKPSVIARARARDKVPPSPTERAATRRQFLTTAGAAAGATAVLARTEAVAAQAPNNQGARRKHELQVALICIADWAGAARQVLSQADQSLKIPIPQGLVVPHGGRQGCPPNQRLQGEVLCDPVQFSSEVLVSLPEVSAVLDRIERLAESLRSGIDPIPPQMLAAFAPPRPPGRPQ